MTDAEINAAVAEHVFGWTYRVANSGFWSIRDGDGETQTKWHQDAVEYDRQTGEKRENPWWEAANVPDYQGDIAAAWTVVKEMVMQDNWRCDIELDNIAPCYAAFYILMGDGTELERHTGQTPTAPEAICLAALRAKGVDV